MRKILIVEDEKKVSRFVERALNEQAYTTHVAGSCAAARDALAVLPEGEPKATLDALVDYVTERRN